MTAVAPRLLVPLALSSAVDPLAWRAVASAGPAAIAVAAVPEEEGPARLAVAGVRTLGYVPLRYGTRPFAVVRAEIAAWAGASVAGLFLDEAPSGPFQLGPVIQAVRAARRDGLAMVVLNPGLAVDPAYRALAATLCTFEGSWTEYLALTPGRLRAGDGHIVHGVPVGELDTARRLAETRGAALLAVTSGPTALGDLRCDPGSAAAGVGSGGRRMTTGS